MIKNSKIAIFGFGKDGLASANYLSKNNQVMIFDQKPKGQINPIFFKKLNDKRIIFYFAERFPKNQKFDLVVRSPGIRPDNTLIVKLTKSSAKLTSSAKIFFDECPCPIIGVTGTKGKGTTATLIYELLKTQYKKVHLAGNIGTPMLEILPRITKDDLVVLELSSFQLIDLKRSPHVAVVLMITKEHLDWHRDLGEYWKSKEPLVANQVSGDFAIINYDFEISRNMDRKTRAQVFFFSTVQRTNGLYIENQQIVSEIGGTREIICPISKVLLPGKHNLQNVMAAVSVAKIYGITNQNIVKVLSTFRGLAHRLEYLGQVGDVRFYNDSFSTIPETTIAAIESIQGPKILILGGSSKNSDFGNLASKIVGDRSVKGLVLIGQEARTIDGFMRRAGGFNGPIIRGVGNMEEIVLVARRLAKPGCSIVLSPACASFDMFKNYQDRGDQFTREIRKLGTR
ncbi:UDP-N-acetylmuramoyl-L-alanine--D-glutamate ligase [Candidatus Curtissbacteria bacterium]|nr:UDP-N-acetylmuramoyl-L-alanine--D-glutamate ligase [Candidatus Curtissbacteria bacterium]